MGVVWVKGAVLRTPTGEDALVHAAVQEAHGVVPATNFSFNPGCSLSTPVSTMAMTMPSPLTPRSHAPSGRRKKNSP